MQLKGKKIFIISPEKWNNLRLSKHHYAEELSLLGNEVYYLNPPESDCSIPSLNCKINDHLNIIDFNTHIKGERFLPFIILSIIRKRQAKKLNKFIGSRIDIVWSFFPNQFFDLQFFDARFRIFHPVDKIEEKIYIKTAATADLVLSVAEYLLKDFRPYNKYCHFINHGLSRLYEKNDSFYEVKDSVCKAGYVGNLLRPDIDHKNFLKIIHSNLDVQFVLWGSYKYEHLDWKHEGEKEVIEFIKELQLASNVELKGLVHPDIVAKESQEMDVFICCYDPMKEINRASNNHKLMEYLSSGKVVVSHFVETYADKRDLLQMCESYANEKLPDLFKEVKLNLRFWNSIEKMEMRKKFAKDNSYLKQIQRIEKLLQ